MAEARKLGLSNADAILQVRPMAGAQCVRAAPDVVAVARQTRIQAGPTVVAYLQAQGVTDIDLIVAAHSDSDHIGGLRDVLGPSLWLLPGSIPILVPQPYALSFTALWPAVR